MARIVSLKKEEDIDFEVDWCIYCPFCQTKYLRPELTVKIEPVNNGSTDVNVITYVKCIRCHEDIVLKHQLINLSG